MNDLDRTDVVNTIAAAVVSVRRWHVAHLGVKKDGNGGTNRPYKPRTGDEILTDVYGIGVAHPEWGRICRAALDLANRDPARNYNKGAMLSKSKRLIAQEARAAS